MGFFGKKPSANSNKEDDANSPQPDKANEEKNENSSQAPPTNQGASEKPKQWEIDGKRRVTAGEKAMLQWLEIGIGPESTIRPVGTKNWKPLKEFFPKECEALSGQTGSPSTDSGLSELKAPVESLQAEVKRLVEEMEYTKAFCNEKQKLVDKLYEENRQYKSAIIEKFKEKLALAVVEQLDFVDDKITFFEKKEVSQENFEELYSLYCELADEFREMLQKRLDMVYFKDEPGSEIDLKRHKILRTHPSEDSSLHKTIKTVKRYGYENEDGKVIRMSLVEAYEYIEPSPSADSEEKTIEETVTSETADAPQTEQATETPKVQAGSKENPVTSDTAPSLESEPSVQPTSDVSPSIG